MLDPGYLDRPLASYSKAMDKPYLAPLAKFRVVHFPEARTEFDGPGWGLLHTVRAKPLRRP